MNTWLRRALQVTVLVIVCWLVALFANWPDYQHAPAQSAAIKLSFTHGSNRQAECRRRTQEELARLPPNMRKPLECPRTRSPVYVELDIDGRTIYQASLPPSGLSGDGPARTYQRFVVNAGPHHIAARMRDTSRSDGFDYEKSGEVVLAAEQNFVIDFRSEAGGFVFR